MTELKFKFKFVNEKGQEEGIFSKKGTVTQESLTLDKDEIPIAAIVKTETKFKRLVFYLAQENGEILPLVLSIPKDCNAVFKQVNSALSFKRAEQRLEELTAQGRADAFQALDCVHCQSVIDLTELPLSPDIYCEYCETIQGRDGVKDKMDAKFHICDQCGYFGQPREFTVFYFYFLLVIYGWRQQQVHMCDTCMRSEAWKMFFGNFIFILGLPFALIQLCRVYFGGSALSKDFKALATANALAKKGKVDKAEKLYQQMLGKAHLPAGLHYNLGLLYARAGRMEYAAQAFKVALQSCVNYWPAIHALLQCYQQLNQLDEAQQLKQLYGMKD